MAKQKPWEDHRWEIIDEISKGGQGRTYSVKRGDQKALMKVLKHTKSMEARERMRQEVINLDIVANAGCKVPSVIEDNTNCYKDISTPLYIIMDYISGDTLAKFITTKILQK